MTENSTVKSDVFSMLLEEPENALEVYNALRSSNFDDPRLIEMCKLESGISISIRNDASFIINNDLNIYEHQSTFNPNMPLRALIYLNAIIKPMVMNRDIYSHKKITIPTPHFVVFYNGSERRPAVEYLKLSDLFTIPDDEPEIEIICKVININPGNNDEFLHKCSILDEYTQFIEKVREYQSEESEKPIEDAIDYCMKHNILYDFFDKKKFEVLRAMTLDMTFERREKYIREEEYAEGHAEGRAEGLTDGAINNMHACIQELLSELGTIPDTLLNRINDERNMERLRIMFRLSAKATSISDFEKNIDNI